jgi:hypothetical protein
MEEPNRVKVLLLSVEISKFIVPGACDGEIEAVRVVDWPIVIGDIMLSVVVVGDLLMVIV